MDGQTDVRTVTKKPREYFINLINEVLRNEDHLTEEFAKNMKFTAMKDLVSYFNKNCNYYDIEYRILHLKNTESYVLITSDTFLEKINNHISVHSLPADLIEVIMNSTSKSQEKLEAILKARSNQRIIELPAPWGHLIGYKTPDNFRDAIHRVVKNLTGETTEVQRELHKDGKEIYFKYIFRFPEKRLF